MYGLIGILLLDEWFDDCYGRLKYWFKIVLELRGIVLIEGFEFLFYSK